MDRGAQRDGRIWGLIHDAWRGDKLPCEDVAIPLSELPEPEPDSSGSTESAKEPGAEPADSALQNLHQNIPS
ncbi:anaphase-promoting complex subunit 13-like [Phyllostomus discolor]|uniref:Anaphase-promoting complex subunit 13 n=1 Tax=Phyllostomus discolor TaxID=89673 RepID=A0A7E6CXR5_9CHIR|nr:anaphase-promoting complex subunit 13-like [Phyllostomus discolor]